jgi:hypothetical protein
MDETIAKNAFLAAGNVKYLSTKLNIPVNKLYTTMVNIVNNTPKSSSTSKELSNMYISQLTQTSSYAPYQFTYLGGPLITTPMRFVPVYCGAWTKTGTVRDAPLTLFNRNIYSSPSDQLFIRDSQYVLNHFTLAPQWAPITLYPDTSTPGTTKYVSSSVTVTAPIYNTNTFTPSSTTLFWDDSNLVALMNSLNTQYPQTSSLTTIPVLFVKTLGTYQKKYSGYHSFFNVSASVSIPYIVVMSDNISVGNIQSIPITSNSLFPFTLFHEITELVTDPYLNAYTNHYDEEGDLCGNFGLELGNVNLNGSQFLLSSVYDWVNKRCFGEELLASGHLYDTIFLDLNTILQNPYVCDVANLSIIVDVNYNEFARYYSYYNAKMLQTISALFNINPLMVSFDAYQSNTLLTAGDSTVYYFSIVSTTQDSDSCDTYIVSMNTFYNNLFTSTAPNSPLKEQDMQLIDAPFRFYYPA